MSYAPETLKKLYDKTNGRCHICYKKLARVNYGKHGRRGAWEVDHSVPRARGGTDRQSNLLPACTTCNRSKQDSTTRVARSEHGHTRRPRSRQEVKEAQNTGAVTGLVSGLLVGARVGGPPGAVVGGLIGFFIGSSVGS